MGQVQCAAHLVATRTPPARGSATIVARSSRRPRSPPSRAPTPRGISPRRSSPPRARSAVSASWSPSSSPTSRARWSSPSASIPRNGIACWIACSGSFPTASIGTRGPSTSTPVTASWRSSAPRSPTRTTPQRACAAALDLARELGVLADHVRRESGLEFAVRMGLNSGEVVVGRIGDDLRMDYTAQGHVVGLAARVQQLAPPGGITVTESTAAPRRPASSTSTTVGSRVSRARPPPCACSGCGVRATSGAVSRAPRARGFSRFVGREREIALPRRGSARSTVRSTESRPGHRGAGRGKEPPLSRVRRARPRRSRFTIARALSHGRRLPFHAIVTLARSLFGVGEGASPSDRPGPRQTRALGNAPLDPTALDFWLELFGVSHHAPAPPGSIPKRDALVSSGHFSILIRTRARREPTVLWIEDLHWLDPASEAALEMLTEHLLAPESAGSPILLLATTRPEYRPAWPSGSRVSPWPPSLRRTPARCSTTGSARTICSRRCAPGSRPGLAAIHSSSRR